MADNRSIIDKHVRDMDVDERNAYRDAQSKYPMDAGARVRHLQHWEQSYRPDLYDHLDHAHSMLSDQAHNDVNGGLGYVTGSATGDYLRYRGI